MLDFVGLKHEPGLKKPGDFKVSEGHRYPLVVANYVPILKYPFFVCIFSCLALRA